MNYYIQGNEDKADQIKAAFKKLGYDTSRHLFNAKSVLYFTLNGEIRATTCNCTPAIIKTHPDYKELELPVQPKFKVGDKVVFGTLHETIAVVLTNEQRYLCESFREILFEEQERWHLAPKPHYDIANFKPFDKVLVRDEDDGKWMAAFYSHYMYEEKDYPYQFATIGTDIYGQCIPFNDDTKHLFRTTDMPSEEFINW